MAERGKILVVDDDQDVRETLRDYFEHSGFDVFVAGDGAGMRRVLAARAVDLVLMDLSLPVLDGWEAARRIKAAPETSRIPIIALTAHAMPGDQEKALAAGCDDFDTKPVEMPRLLGKIRALVPAGSAP